MLKQLNIPVRIYSDYHKKYGVGINFEDARRDDRLYLGHDSLISPFVPALFPYFRFSVYGVERIDDIIFNNSVYVSCSVKEPPSGSKRGKDIKIKVDERIVGLRTLSFIPQIGSSILINNSYIGSYIEDKQILFIAHDIFNGPYLIGYILEKLPLLKQKWNYNNILPKITLGADPEFEELIKKDTYEPMYSSYKGVDPKKEIGCDGAGMQLELRPKPSFTPTGLVKNIAGLIEKIPPVSVRGDHYPLGGHIHFGIPYKQEYIEVLDDFLGRKLLELSGVARGGYRNLGAIEPKSYGFEYRSLPSSWLLNPRIARIVLKIAYKAVYLLSRGFLEYEVGNKGVKFSEYLRLKILSENELKYFKSFLKDYSNYNGLAINSNWSKSWKDEKKGRIFYVGSDWDTDIWRTFSNLINSNFPERDFNIIFYICRSNGRTETTIPTEPTEFNAVHIIKDSYSNYGNKYSGIDIGVSPNIAQGYCSKSFLDSLKDGIIKYINSKRTP